MIDNHEGFEIVAINDLTSPKMLAHLLKYDSTQGKYALADKVEAGEDVPNTHPSVEGIFMPRDTMITVINLKNCLNLPQTDEKGLVIITKDVYKRQRCVCGKP